MSAVICSYRKSKKRIEKPRKEEKEKGPSALFLMENLSLYVLCRAYYDSNPRHFYNGPVRWRLVGPVSYAFAMCQLLNGRHWFPEMFENNPYVIDI